jgi:hypothetical protein
VTCPPKTDPNAKLEQCNEGGQGDDPRKAFYPGGDYWDAAGSQSGVICYISALYHLAFGVLIY